MKHSQTMRKYAKAFVAFAVLTMAGACADNGPASPGATEVQGFKVPANFTQVGSAVVFQVNNSEGITQTIGSHVISIPAGAICDLVTSGYGKTMWDQPCDPQQGSVTITASVFADPDGMPYVDFQPAMRFSPSKEVMLFLRQGTNEEKRLLTVKYCDNTGICIDESLTDPSVKPFRIAETSIIGRRVKHFSGYVVFAREECEAAGGTPVDNGDGTWWCEMGGEGFSRRSGYMVASGENIEDVMPKKESVKKDEH